MAQAKLAGPTGGYIIGFIAMAIIAGLVIDHFHQPWLQLIGMIVGTIICYVLGTAWFCFEAKSTVSGALSICVFPFIPGDLIKMIIAMLIGPAIKKRASLNINSKLSKLLIQARYPEALPHYCNHHVFPYNVDGKASLYSRSFLLYPSDPRLKYSGQFPLPSVYTC